MNASGDFNIDISIEEKNKLIFTGLGCTVKVYSVEEIKDILSK